MPFIIDVHSTFPKNKTDQKIITEHLLGLWGDRIKNKERVKSIHENVQVTSRNLALNLEDYKEELSFEDRNNLFIEKALELITAATSSILNQYELEPKQVKSIWSNTVTGFAIPSLEARLMNKLDFDVDTKRVPMMGLGCMAGIAGINRVADYLKGHPNEAALFLSVELCTLTLQLKDISAANLVSTGLFGDGAAAVLMVGDNHPLAKHAKLKWLASKSVFFKDSQDVMGWKVSGDGLTIQLQKDVPEFTQTNLSQPLQAFLKQEHLSISSIDSFFAHPGGPKVLTALEKVLDLPQGGLRYSWESLSANGNMSSVSVLDIMARQLKNSKNNLTGRYALGLAMGPAFSAELGLFQWV